MRRSRVPHGEEAQIQMRKDLLHLLASGNRALISDGCAPAMAQHAELARAVAGAPSFHQENCGKKRGTCTLRICGRCRTTTLHSYFNE